MTFAIHVSRMWTFTSFALMFQCKQVFGNDFTGCSRLLNHQHFLNEKANRGHHFSVRASGKTALETWVTRYVLCFGVATHRPDIRAIHFLLKRLLSKCVYTLTFCFLKKSCQGSLSLNPLAAPTFMLSGVIKQS